jgi:protein-L-isoaspartate(D-aspartate) O-methyltransferase
VFPWHEDVHKARREKMVKQQIERRGVKDPAVLKAMQSVKRHEFVPASEVDNAYEDRPLPIGHGQTISQPYIVAYMTEMIQPKPGLKVLEIGTGSGYQATVLSAIVKEVYTIEIVPELGNAAANRLKKSGYKNIQAKIDDGYNGWKEHAPYDAIIVTAAAEYIPPPLIEQLKDGGQMVIPVGSPFMTQMLMLVEKTGKKITTKSLLPVAFVPFTRKN